MNQEHAAAVAAAMTGLWRMEMPATVRVLSSVKDEQREYRPHAKSRSAWELAVHIATADMWFIDCIQKGVFQFDPEAVKQAEAKFARIDEVVSFYERALPGMLDQLGTLSAEELATDVDFFGMMRMPRAQWIGFANNHSVHHRGQLSAYLRAMGSRVPDIYGPSGDAEPATAS